MNILTITNIHACVQCTSIIVTKTKKKKKEEEGKKRHKIRTQKEKSLLMRVLSYDECSTRFTRTDH